MIDPPFQVLFLSLWYFQLLVIPSQCFIIRSFLPSYDVSSSRFQLPATSTTTTDRLLQTIEGGPRSDEEVMSFVTELERTGTQQLSSSDDDARIYNSRFQSLVGLYDVVFTKTKSPKNNPVGGKWTRSDGFAQKILKTRRTFQHVLPVNGTGCGLQQLIVGEEKNNTTYQPVVAEAINVISLEALSGLIRLTVILRGDAIALTETERSNRTEVIQPLSSLAVKVLFDAPRIIVGSGGRKGGRDQVFFNMNIGPKTSVLLDTLYLDTKVRIGMGGTSGTRFVFRKCSDDDMEANEFRSLLVRKPMRRRKALLSLAAAASAGIYGAIAGRARILGGFVSTFTIMLGGLIAFSGGGVERA